MTSAAWVVRVGLGGIAAALAIGCSSTIIEDDDDGGGGATSTSGNGTTTTSGNGTTNASSSSTGGACQGFDDATTGTPLTIRVHNPGFQPIYLPINCGTPAYEINTGPENPGTFPGHRSCTNTCENLQTSPRLFCGACLSEAQRIDPGGSYDIPWDGRGLLQTTMPLACFEDPNDGDACERFVAGKPGFIYSFQIAGFNSCEDGVNACTCTSDGRCTGEASGVSAGISPSAGEFVLGNTAVFDVYFDMCAFGCPND